MTDKNLIALLNSSLDPLNQWMRGAALEHQALEQEDEELAESYYQLRTANWDEALDLVYAHISTEDFFHPFNEKVNDLITELLEEYGIIVVRMWSRLVSGGVMKHGDFTRR
jgi:hypothetical protein